jgi:CO/xanthine dehydrogenase Mo-binding subunit
MDPASTEGQTIRNLVEQVNDKPPEDLHVLSRIYRIRNIRNEYARRDSSGAVVPISYEEAARLARSLVPEIFTNTDPVLARQQERDAINRGAENRQKTFAPEVPAARAAQEPDVSQIQLEEFNILMKKPRKEYNAQENELVRKVMKDLAKMSDQEIEDWFKSPGG